MRSRNTPELVQKVAVVAHLEQNGDDRQRRAVLAVHDLQLEGVVFAVDAVLTRRVELRPDSFVLAVKRAEGGLLRLLREVQLERAPWCVM